MKKYTKIIDGKTFIKKINEIIVTIYDEKKTNIDGVETIIKTPVQCVYNPSEELVLNDGWEVYIEPVVPEKTIEQIRDMKHEEILKYDSSSEVNEFYINEIPVWLDKATRAGLMLRFQAEKAMGKEETVLWYNDMQFPLLLDNAFSLLYAIEIYASACYDNTQRHIYEIDKLQTIEEIEEYNYREGYPDKLHL